MRAAEADQASNPAIVPNLAELCSLEESELCEQYQQQIEELNAILRSAQANGDSEGAAADVIVRLVAENAVLAKQIETMQGGK
mmetsp:Transcript_37242/g.116435  ORF Transcript_37242/g.116435 Transcript_37242/m.116435 type:complete len:83 (+) Transcript_37242:419-667(+)